MPWAVTHFLSSIWKVGAGPGPSLRFAPGHLRCPLSSFLVPILSLVLAVDGSGPALFRSGTRGGLSLPLPLVELREGQGPSSLCAYAMSNVGF